MMQAQTPIHRPAHRGLAPSGMLHQRPSLDALGERAPIGLALAPFLWLETMQLTVMPGERRNADQASIIRDRVPSYHAISQTPGIYRMSFPDFGQLLAGLFQAQL